MRDIVIAPVSHNRLRDWPAGHYAQLIGLLLDRIDASDRISVVGTRGQRLASDAIVRTHPVTRVANLCGTMPWPEVLALIGRARCVIGNNSGITHVSRQQGVPTVCIFGGSHQRTEWGPLGSSAMILSRATACSPCHLNHVWECPYGVACLADIAPEEVARAVLAAMRTHDAATGALDDERRVPC